MQSPPGELIHIVTGPEPVKFNESAIRVFDSERLPVPATSSLVEAELPDKAKSFVIV